MYCPRLKFCVQSRKDIYIHIFSVIDLKLLWLPTSRRFLDEMNSENPETYINHPTWGLLYRISVVDDAQEMFTTLYAQRLFFLVTNDPKGLKFQSIGRTEARMMVENRLRNLRRTGQSQEYDQLQGVFQRTFQ